MKPQKLIGFFTMCAILLIPLCAHAIHIDPATETVTLAVGGSVVLHKSVVYGAGDLQQPYNEVSLYAVDYILTRAGLTLTTTPGSYSYNHGYYDADEGREFDFDVVIRDESGVEGTYNIEIYPVFDGAVVGPGEADTIVRVASSNNVPLPPPLLLLGSGLLGLAGARLKQRRRS